MRFALLLLFFCACDESGTGGRAVELNVEVRPVQPGVMKLGEAEVTLTRAELELTAVYVLDQPPPTVSLLRRILDLGIPAAHAHAGHDFFAGGQVLTEWIHPVTVDLLNPATPLGRVPGIEGEAKSASVLLWPREGRSLFVEGVVTRAGMTSPFSVNVSLDGAPETQRVDFTHAEGMLDDDVTLVIEPNVAAWFSGATFGEDDGSQVARALQLNLRRHTAWQVRAVR